MMFVVEWYSGGQERKKVALRLLAELYQSSDRDVLRNFFRRYIENLNEGISVPFALSAFNLELSSVLIKNKITLSKEQEEKIYELRQLSSIRYGYPN